MSDHVRVALVTGANRGIGLETARQLAAEGITVVMAGRDEAAINKAAKTLADEGLRVLPVALDVTNEDQALAVRDKIAADFGHLDILVNNAGIISGEGFWANSSLTITKEDLRKTFEVNVIAPIALSQVFLPLLKKSPAGRIVNLSSILGSLAIHRDWTNDFKNFKPVAYDASKAALNMATVHLAAELQDTNIKVNAAHPGWVKTDMGGDQAPMDVVTGAKTSVALATLDDDGPTGAFIHLGEELPW